MSAREPMTPRSRHRDGLADEAGSVILEFALLAPVFLLVLAATVDISSMVYTKFRLNASVTAAAQYALLNRAQMTTGSGSDFAGNLIKILTKGHAGTPVTATASINNGITASSTNDSVTTSGAAANARSCYCPTYDAGGMIWGAGVLCTANCPSGSAPGKYVTVRMTKPYTNLFVGWGIVSDGVITAQAAVQAE